MELTTEQADELIVNTALAAMYHNDDYAALEESAGLHAAVTAALEPLVDVEITADERESLRVSGSGPASAAAKGPCGSIRTPM